jgi:hypothetical protein
MKLLDTFIIFLAFTAILIIGCGQNTSHPESNYRYAHGEIVPDSLRDDMAKFVTETMRASDQHLTTSDYEDVDDVVEQVTHTAREIYSTSVEGLEYDDPNDNSGVWYRFIPYSQLTDKQKIIFDSLKINQQ